MQRSPPLTKHSVLPRAAAQMPKQRSLTSGNPSFHMILSGERTVRKPILMHIEQEASSLAGHAQSEKASSLHTDLLSAAFQKLAASGKIGALTHQQ